jgi:hypothetical protein
MYWNGERLSTELRVLSSLTYYFLTISGVSIYEMYDCSGHKLPTELLSFI